MSFDKPTRNLLAKMVAACRDRLAGDITDQLQSTYGLYPDGTVLEVATTADDRYATEELLALLRHYEAQLPATSTQVKIENPRQSDGQSKIVNPQAYQRLVREIGFTTLNRLAALRLAEECGLVIECVRRGMASDGFQLFDRLTGGALGHRHQSYRAFLENLFDELGRVDISSSGGYLLYQRERQQNLALALGLLFDRHTPLSIIFPGEAALIEVLELLNDSELAASQVWRQDETIGWIYQYYNDPSERKAMRDASQAPRNSHELAVRNQFFTPRYVVEFLTDNTLGRTWYEMRRGETALVEQCRYLVRRPNEVFLTADQEPPTADEMETTGEIQNLKSKIQNHYVPYRAKKDPRDLKILDPAVGSGHFLLYCFDLLLTIYEEAWGDPEVPPFSETSTTLVADYRNLADLRWAAPELILRHNLHGLDIDPRAVQIAALALWLRTQRVYQSLGLSAAECPPITKTNLVTAEPMPGDQSLLEEFVRDRYPRVLVGLVRAVFKEMELAGEAGALIKIEEALKEAIAAAKRQDAAEKRLKQGSLPGLEQTRPEQLTFDLSDLPNDQYWARVEKDVLTALRDYAEHVENGAATRRRLFAKDTSRGFAFIDLCCRQYDVVLMNPPFGDASTPSKSYIEETYGDTKGDIYKAFVERFQNRLVPRGFLGIISSRSGFFLGQSQDWRERIVLRLYRPLLLADFGFGVLDAMVETAAYVLQTISEQEDKNLILQILPDLLNISTDKQGCFSIPKYQKQRGGLKRHQATKELNRLLKDGYITEIEGHFTRYQLRRRAITKAETPTLTHYPSLICFRLLGENDQGQTLLDVIHDPSDPRCFVVPVESFFDVPGTPFSYWITDRVRALFKTLPPFESDGRTVKQGLETADNFRFIRTWWEVPSEKICSPVVHPTIWSGSYCVLGGYQWYPFPKGGIYSPYYADLHLAVNWRRDGEEMKAWADPLYGNSGWSRIIKSVDLYFRPGLTYPRRLHRMAVTPLPRGSIISVRGSGIYGPQSQLATMAGLFSSSCFDFMVKTMLGRFGHPQFDNGTLCRTPIPYKLFAVGDTLGALATTCITSKRVSDTTDETSHVFSRPALLQTTGDSLNERAANWTDQVSATEVQLAICQQQVDDIVFQLYALDDSDRQSIAASLNHPEPGSTADKSDEDKAESAVRLDQTALTAESLSYLVGIAFGRWDTRLALDPSLTPQLQDPFDPLPACSPGMLLGPDGLPATPGNIVSESWLRARPNAITLPPEGSVNGPAIIPDTKYPLPIVWDGILVDDPDHPSDLVRHVRGTLALLWPDQHEDIETEVCETLGVKELRDYFRKPGSFFADHLKRYSKSRRQAPIYWPLSTPSGGYTLWLYYHRLTDQTLYTAVNRYVTPKIEQVEAQVTRLESELNQTLGRSTTDLQDQLAAARAFLTELRGFRDELLRIVGLPYKPNLNDGAIINAAPLHKLFRLSKWAKDTEAVWKKLQKGDCDWAHLAYILCPDRVQEVCRRDRSIAIAHGLEQLCEVLEVKHKTEGRWRRTLKERQLEMEFDVDNSD